MRLLSFLRFMGLVPTKGAFLVTDLILGFLLKEFINEEAECSMFSMSGSWFGVTSTWMFSGLPCPLSDGVWFALSYFLACLSFSMF